MVYPAPLTYLGTTDKTQTSIVGPLARSFLQQNGTLSDYFFTFNYNEKEKKNRWISKHPKKADFVDYLNSIEKKNVENDVLKLQNILDELKQRVQTEFDAEFETGIDQVPFLSFFFLFNFCFKGL